MDDNGEVQDPYSRKDYWIRYFSSKTQAELHDCWNDFESFSEEIEESVRIVMSGSRISICQEVLLELLQRHSRLMANKNQTELFD